MVLSCVGDTKLETFIYPDGKTNCGKKKMHYLIATREKLLGKKKK